MKNQNKSFTNNLSDFEDILVIDKEGIIIFYDMANPFLFDLKPEEVLGKKVSSLYKNLTDENSTLMIAARCGKSICNYKQKLITEKDRVVYQIGSTFPIMDGDYPIGAIEFSKYVYSKDSINYIKGHSTHKVYRKNNTVYTIEDIVTIDKRMKTVIEKIKKAGATESSVLLCGDTGTGKEMVAQAIHNYSNRRSHPFISLNCSAIPSTLLESTLFGTIRGSYTGANDNMGLFEAAENGTLFLDEINSMDPMMQVKLLKAIEEKMIRRVGSAKNINLNVRIIAAVNQNLKKLLKEEKIRRDLFYRLSVIEITLPSLKERSDDIEYLTKYFIDYYNKRLAMKIDSVSNEVMELFKKYSWPGNVRELKNVIEGSFSSVNGNVINISDILDRIVDTNEHNDLQLPELGSVGIKEYIEEIEKKIIKETIKNCGDNLSETARRLKISRQLLKYKIEKYY